MPVNHQQEQMIIAKIGQNKKKTTEIIKNNNGVIITVYIESKTLRSHEKRSNPIKKQPWAKSTTGYDRRAQLLGYSRQLREAKNGDHHQVQWPRTSSKSPKAKERLRIGFLEDVQKGRRRGVYERITMEDDSSIVDKRSKKMKKASNKRKQPPLCRRLSCVLKDLLGCQGTTAL